MTETRDEGKSETVTNKSGGESSAARKQPTQYTHVVCETDMVMDDEMKDRYYGTDLPVHSLFCTTCNAGIRIGEDGEMVWTGSKDKVPEKRDTTPLAA